MQNLRRLLWITSVLARHALARALGPRLRSIGWLDRRLPPADLDGPQRLRAILEEIGGTFIKFGQLLAMQPDFVSLDYCNALCKLLDRVEPFPFEEAERVFVEELGRRPDQVFEWIERQPLATASVGQVHLAGLDGGKVAVKIQRPAVRREFAGDVRLMTFAMRVIRALRLRRLYWLLEPLGEFVIWTREELDYRHEARYMERLRLNSRDNPAQRVPAVHARYTTARTLVAEYLAGPTLLDYLRARESGDEVLLGSLRARRFDPQRFAANIIDTFFADVFRHGVYHADPHPANLVILPDSVVGYVDFGITGVMSAHGRQHLVVMTLALARGDLDTLSTHFLEVSSVGDADAAAAFHRDLTQLAEPWYPRTEPKRLGESITRVMTEMLHLSRRADVLPERDVIKYIRSAISLDGLIQRFAPEFDLSGHLVASCRRLMAEERFASSLSLDNLIRWSSASARFMTAGVPRAVAFLDRVGGHGAPTTIQIGAVGQPRSGQLRRRSLLLSLLALGLALLIASGSTAGAGGLLPAAAATLMAMTLVLLARTLRRLTST